MSTRQQKILQYVEELPQKNPSRWQFYLERARRYAGVLPPEETAKLAKEFIEASLTPDKDLIPKSIQWAGRKTPRDYNCPICEPIQEPGIMRYLGRVYAGTEQVTVEKRDSDGDPYFEDQSRSLRVYGWRCDLCGHEYTDV